VHKIVYLVLYLISNSNRIDKGLNLGTFGGKTTKKLWTKKLPDSTGEGIFGAATLPTSSEPIDKRQQLFHNVVCHVLV
jgi:hypothetical protein